MKTFLNPTDASEVLTRLDKIRPDTQRKWGKMNAHQMVCHLSDGMRLYMGLKVVKPVAVPYPRWFLKWVALWTPLPWPKGFKTAPELDQDCGGTVPSLFHKDIEELRSLVECFTRDPKEFVRLVSHPHFGVMGEKDWARLAHLHIDHHLRQFGA